MASLTKGGLNAVTKSLAIERRGSRNSRQRRRARHHPHPDATRRPYETLAKLHPVGQIGEVEDVVDAVLHLERPPVTGEILHVDGGQSAGHDDQRRGAARRS